MSNTPLVQLKHIQKRFGGVHAVEDVSFDVEPGEEAEWLEDQIDLTHDAAVKMAEGAALMTDTEIDSGPEPGTSYVIDGVFWPPVIVPPSIAARCAR